MAVLIRYCSKCRYKLNPRNPNDVCGACSIGEGSEVRLMSDRCEGRDWFSGLRCNINDAQWNGSHYACQSSRDVCILPSSSDSVGKVEMKGER